MGRKMTKKARIIDGRAISKEVLDEVRKEAAGFAAEHGRPPGLAVVLIGDDPASGVYVRMKTRACGDCGIESFSHSTPENTSTEELLELIDKLNDDESVDGILVQLPLPGQIDTRQVLDRVSPAKDVDGFHPVNVGRLVRGDDNVLLPCTPVGIMKLLDSAGVDPHGKRAVVIGRSDIVGKPIAMLLLHRHATVTICHSRTPDLPGVAREADILIAAVGRPLMVRRDWIKEGAVVIDVGTNQLTEENAPEEILSIPEKRADLEKKGYTLVGDVALDADQVAGMLTPSPGGVGPMTIASLMGNTVKAAVWRAGNKVES